MGNDLRNLLNAAEAQSCTVERTQKGRWLIRNAEGVPSPRWPETPSDHRSWRNGMAVLRRAGFAAAQAVTRDAPGKSEPTPGPGGDQHKRTSDQGA